MKMFGVGVNTIFIGTSEFAVPALQTVATSNALKAVGIKLALVITAPDAKAGRGQKLTPPPVKVEAQKLGIKVWQPALESQSDSGPDPKGLGENFKSKIKQLNPDLIVLAAYGKILPAWLIHLPPYGALNIHPSLLPKYRGATPLQTALLNGDTHTGVSIIKMDEKVDHGPIIAEVKLEITPEEIYSSLEAKTASLGAELFEKTVPLWISGKIRAQAQDDSRASMTKQIKKEDGRIDWRKSAIEIERRIRAFEAWPGSFTDFNAQSLKVIKASMTPQETDATPGTVIRANGNIGVVTGDGILILGKVQPAGKKEMSVEDFVRGHHEFIGTILT